ncbi:protein EFFECTOR OF TRANSCRIPTION 2-like [Oryza brachyantha]|uniref:GIY-YIG domain-containing protein n=1 Tax=Oryza brachyantha TaxID=4533 RepID=J3MMH7_ORYBR|nr:protein EFFECTOR OF TRANSCRIPTION 2-like [Oryza brachyantha]
MPAASAAVPARLKREDCPRTKHDSLFSPWNVLVGPSDWEDHAAGKEGVQRYRVLNLPENFPGLYELGVARASDEGIRARRNGPGGVVVVYLGQADNVRARLQQYGRTGSHLNAGSSLSSAGKAGMDPQVTGNGLFREVFARGYSMVFRCALMGNKQQAEKTEAQLLRVFDYAWNKLQNSSCRREEILIKLEQGAVNHRSSLLRRVQNFKQEMFREKAGIKISRNGPADVSSGIMKNMLPRIRTFVGFRPQLVNSGNDVDKEIGIHQKKTSGGNSCCNKQARKSEGYKVKKVDVMKRKTVPEQDSNTVCGVMLGDGSSCLEPPVQGRKRCELHKGRRLGRITINPKGSSYSYQVEIPSVESIPPLTENESKSDRAPQTGELLSKLLPATVKEPSRPRNSFEAKETETREAPIEKGTHETSGIINICEAKERDNSACNNKVVLGSKTCQLHNGCEEEQFDSFEKTDLLQNEEILHRMAGDKHCGEEICHAKSQSLENQPSGRMWFELIKLQNSTSTPSSKGLGCHRRVTPDVATMCGALTENGCCKTTPMAGRERCDEHEGIKVTDASSVPFSGSSGWPSICGARASDGSPCKNQPIAGRKRCPLHKGQRACRTPQSNE